MKTTKLDRGRATLPARNRIITREEYDALMSELAREAIRESTAPISDIYERVRKLEFDLMVLVGFILTVLILCHHR